MSQRATRLLENTKALLRRLLDAGLLSHQTAHAHEDRSVQNDRAMHWPTIGLGLIGRRATQRVLCTKGVLLYL